MGQWSVEFPKKKNRRAKDKKTRITGKRATMKVW